MNPDYNQVPPNQQWQGNQVPPPPPPPPPLPTPETPPYNPWQQNDRAQPSSPPETYAGYRPTAPLPGPAANMPASSAPEWQRPAPPPPQPIEQEPVSYGTHDYEPLPRPRRWPAITFAAIIIMLLAGVGYTGYKAFFVTSDKKSTATQPSPTPTPPPPTPQPKPTPQPQPTPPPTPPPATPVVVDLGTLTSAALNAPADIAGLRANDLGVATVKDYTDPSGKCDLQFGTLPASSLPGGNLNELLAPQLDALRANGAIITGPTISLALELKDAADSTTTYTLSTAVVSFVQGAKHGTSHYSASILKNGDRAFVSRSCVNASGPIDPAALDALDAKAKQITITKQ